MHFLICTSLFYGVSSKGFNYLLKINEFFAGFSICNGVISLLGAEMPSLLIIQSFSEFYGKSMWVVIETLLFSCLKIIMYDSIGGLTSASGTIIESLATKPVLPTRLF